MSNPEQITQLKGFVDFLKSNPDVLHTPQLAFFREWLESLGATLPRSKSSDIPPPQASAKADDAEPTAKPAWEESEEEDSEEEEVQPIVESDLDVDMEGVIEPDTDAPQPMGDTDKPVSEDDEAKCESSAALGNQALGDQEWETAVTHYTEAISFNPNVSRLFFKRARCYIKMNKPNCAIRDCDRCLEINPDSAQGLKWRGRAFMLLGKFEEAVRDFGGSCTIDYDDTVAEWLKSSKERATKIVQHRIKYNRLKDEAELTKRRKAHEKARKEAEKRKRSQPSGDGHSFGGGMPGGGMPRGGMPGGGMPGGGMPGMEGLFSDPEIMGLLQDPDVMAAFTDIQKNPANMGKHASNPKVQRVMEALQKKMGGPGGMPGMGMGGMPGMGGMGMGGMPGMGMGGMPGMGSMPDMGGATPNVHDEDVD